MEAWAGKGKKNCFLDPYANAARVTCATIVDAVSWGVIGEPHQLELNTRVQKLEEVVLDRLGEVRTPISKSPLQN